MSVNIQPTELCFRRPFTTGSIQTLRLENLHEEPIAFKVKTTSPKQYCVRPNAGTIDPHQTVEIKVLRQAVKEEPPPTEKCRDKFLVQSGFIHKDVDSKDVAKYWPLFEQSNTGSIHEKKIRVSFDFSDDVGFKGVDANVIPSGTAEKDTASRDETPNNVISKSTLSQSNVPQHRERDVESIHTRNSDSNLSSSQSTAFKLDPKSLSNSTSNKIIAEFSEKMSELNQTRDQDPFKNSSISHMSQASINKMVAELAEKTAELERYKKLEAAEPPVLRRHHEIPETNVSSNASQTLNASRSIATTQHDSAIGGVPVAVTALLCLLSFLVSYFFF